MSKNTVDAALLERQRGFMDRLSDMLSEYFEHKPKFFVHTYGCQQNVSDSERIKGLLVTSGFQETDDVSEADFILYNTCAVRAHAEDRVYGNLGALKKNKRRNLKTIIAICGCMVQQQSVADRIKRSYPYVDIVFGTHSAYKLPEFIYSRITGGPRVFCLEETEEDIAEGMPVKRDSNLKGWLPVMYGCNNFCTYCIVPYVRGRERSRAPEDIIKEAKELIASGCKEITLLGQNVNSYGKNTDYGVDFATLLRMINDIEGDFRIRFMTSHPKDCTDALLDAMRDCDKVCKHLHLPFQAGSDRVLKEMNRRYTSADYLELIRKAKERMPDICLTSDIIVGFPGETYEEFKKTLDIVRQVQFSSLFTFIYSSRPGTVAAEMEDNVSREEKGKWFSELLKCQEQVSKEMASKYIGRTLKVICDDVSVGDGQVSGHSDGNATVVFRGDETMYGRFVDVEITENNGLLSGKVKKVY